MKSQLKSKHHQSQLHNPRQKLSPLAQRTTVDEKGRFYQLAYLFQQPNIRNVPTWNKRRNSDKCNRISMRTPSFTQIRSPATAKRNCSKEIEMTNEPKNQTQDDSTQKLDFFLGVKRSTIHSKRFSRRIREKIAEHTSKQRQQSTENELKQRIKSRILQGSNLIKLTSEQQNPFFSRSYLFGRQSNQRIAPSINTIEKIQNTSNSQNSKTLDTPSKLPMKVQSYQKQKKMTYRRTSVKLYRPWSPFRMEDPPHLQINQLFPFQ